MKLEDWARFGRHALAVALLCVSAACMASAESSAWRQPAWNATLWVAGLSLFASLPRLLPHYRMSPVQFWTDRVEAAKQGGAPLFLPVEVVANWMWLAAFAFHACT